MLVLGVILSALAGFAAGSVWYMFFGERWMKSIGRTMESMAAKSTRLPFILAFAANLLTAGMMSHVFLTSGVSGFGVGLIAGLGVGLFMIAPWIATNHAFAIRSQTLWWIDSGHVVVAAAAIGAVLGLFV
ncbi:DUF1761 domain-containing protein [Rhodobacteraceae bacterium NNCM2]|nr:DUF1761 domain-containing protein [Coraliihabitans acroporae]